MLMINMDAHAFVDETGRFQFLCATYGHVSSSYAVVTVMVSV
jgi:hypothetical protein